MASLFAALLVVASCPSGPGDVRTGPPRPALARAELPSLVLAPGRVAYFAGVRRLTSLIEGARALVDTLRALDTNLTAERADQEFRKEFGASPLQTLEIEDAGLDPGGDAAVFSTGISPTFVFKIGDDAKLTKFLGERTKSLTTYLRSHRGVAVTSWSSSPEMRGSFLRLRGYLLIHFEQAAASSPPQKTGKVTPKPEPSLEWLDQILAAAEKGSGPDALGWVLAAAGDRRDLLLFANPELIARAAAATVKSPEKSCADGDAELAKAQRLAAGIGFRPRAVRALLQAELRTAAAKELGDQLSDGPRLPASIWDKAPARIEWQLDPVAIATWSKRVAQPRCGPLQATLGELRGLLNPIEQNRTALEHAGRALSAALLASDEKGQGTLLYRGAILGRAPQPADTAYLERQLTLEPGEEKVGSRRVRKVSSNLTLAEPVQVLFADGLLRLAAGDGMMEKLLGAQRREPKGQPLIRFELEPGKLADLRAAMKLLDDAPAPAPPPGLPAWFAHGRRSRTQELDQMAAWLATFARVKLQASLAGQNLRLDGEYTLR